MALRPARAGSSLRESKWWATAILWLKTLRFGDGGAREAASTSATPRAPLHRQPRVRARARLEHELLDTTQIAARLPATWYTNVPGRAEAGTDCLRPVRLTASDRSDASLAPQFDYLDREFNEGAGPPHE